MNEIFLIAEDNFNQLLIGMHVSVSKKKNMAYARTIYAKALLQNDVCHLNPTGGI